MAFNNIVSRADAQALMPEEVSDEFMGYATKKSAVLTLFTHTPVSRAQVRFPIVSALPIAFWVTGDTGLKQTSEVNWSNKYMNIEELAVIMPMPDSVVEDAEIGIWDRSMPYLVEALGRQLDSTAFFGTSAPASFPTDIYDAAVAAGNHVEAGAAAAAGGFYGDFDSVLALVEADGFDPDGVVAANSTKGQIRAARSTQGERLDLARVNGDMSTIDGMTMIYPMRGLFPSGGSTNTNVRLFAGDFSQFIVGVRRDITMDIFREGVIQDNSGAIVFNLMQQDMTAVRLTFRVGWQVANLINRDQPVEANRYPVGVLRF